jgi:hypothetical protein
VFGPIGIAVIVGVGVGFLLEPTIGGLALPLGFSAGVAVLVGIRWRERLSARGADRRRATREGIDDDDWIR